MPKKKLHPALQANADKLKAGKPLYDRKSTASSKSSGTQRPKIRSKKGK